MPPLESMFDPETFARANLLGRPQLEVLAQDYPQLRSGSALGLSEFLEPSGRSGRQHRIGVHPVDSDGKLTISEGSIRRLSRNMLQQASLNPEDSALSDHQQRGRVLREFEKFLTEALEVASVLPIR